METQLISMFTLYLNPKSRYYKHPHRSTDWPSKQTVVTTCYVDIPISDRTHRQLADCRFTGMAGSVTELQHTIALKWFATCFTGDMVDSLSLQWFRMLRPLFHTAAIRAEPFFFRLACDEAALRNSRKHRLPLAFFVLQHPNQGHYFDRRTSLCSRMPQWWWQSPHSFHPSPVDRPLSFSG